MAKLTLPSNLQLAVKVLEYETQRTAKALEMGWFGRVFGTIQEKPGNIAGAAIVASFFCVGRSFDCLCERSGI